MGMVVTVDVIPREGWALDRWAGPVFDKAGNTAKIKMTSGLSVVIKMKTTVEPIVHPVAITPLTKKPIVEPTKTPTAEPPKPPTAKPTVKPTYTEVGRGGNSVGLEPKVCAEQLQHASEHQQRIPLQKGDRFEVSVTTPPGQPVTVTVKSPHSGRKTFGAADTTHDVRFEAIDDGTYVLIIAAGWPRRVLPGESDGNACARLKGQIQYEYIVSRPNSK
jgi:hypothetical protein